MKKLLLTSLLVLVFSLLSAQYVEIPDTNFRKYLKAQYPTCFSGESMDTTCAGILNATYLSVYNKSISNLDGVQYFKSLKTLDAFNNKLVDLPTLPDSLTSLYCDGNQLTSLPILPSSLKALYCSSNKLTDLPRFSNSLFYLNCWNNLLTSLPELPSSLITLSCYNNELSVLPDLPSSLNYLECGGNQLTSLPDLPSSLKLLECGNNQLTSLPNLPISLNSLYCTSNNIYCLPFLPKSMTDSIEFDFDKIKCFPNKPIALDWSYKFKDFPICNQTNNENNCQAYPQITGYVYQDFNKNGVRDVYQSDIPNSIEPARGNVKVSLSSGNYTFTDENGYYEITSPDTGEVVLTIESPNYHNAIPATSNFHFTVFGEIIEQDIALQANESIDEASLTITPLTFARPGFKLIYRIDLENTGTVNFAPVLNFDYDETKLSFDSVQYMSKEIGLWTKSSVGVISDLGDRLLFNYDSYVVFPGEKKSFNLYFTISPESTKIGDTLYAKLDEMHHLGSSLNSSSNYLVVRGSYDPNDKQATPALTPDQVSEGKAIDYTIRFQNTGTDTAFTVVIADTLSPDLQWNTLEMVSTSHKCEVSVEDSLVYFTFNDILLADSNINEPASHGYVRFTIKPIETLILGDQIENKAAIYFDFNAPIITNTAITMINEIGEVTATKKSSNQKTITLFPNPTEGIIHLSGISNAKLSILNANGIMVLEKYVSENEAIDISSLSKGLYFYSIDQEVSGKFIVK